MKKLILLALIMSVSLFASGTIEGEIEKQPLNISAIIMFLIFVGGTLVITYWAAKRTKTAKDFYTAGGGITGFQNGMAIAGDYMSAASFLGISGLVYLAGYDGLIYSIGFLVGWPIILFLVSERLRNLGKYTFADVAAYRLKQTPIRTLAAFGSIATGNTEKRTIIGEGLINYGDGENYKHLIISTYSYGESLDIKNTNKGLIHYRFTHYIENDYDYELFAQDEFNEFQNMKFRLLGGGNIRKRIRLFERVFLGSGLMYSFVKANDNNVLDKDRKKIKFNFYGIFSHKFNDLLSLNGLVFYQPTLYNIVDEKSFDFNDYRLSSRFSLVSKISENFEFKVNLDYNYHSKPFNGVKPDDMKTTAGITFKIQ